MERFLQDNKNAKIYVPRDRNPKTQNVHLTKGMPIIAHKTNKNLDILNSQTFTITKVTKDFMSYKDDKIEYHVPINDFHKYFYLGFCITVHASQGETFTQRYTIHDWDIPCFCEKAKYVAMSRSTDISHIQITQPQPPSN